MTLERELQAYRSHLDDLLGPDDVNEGKYTVIKGDEIQGPFEDYDSALAFAYDRYGLGPFLVKKVERHETVHHFGRDLH